MSKIFKSPNFRPRLSRRIFILTGDSPTGRAPLTVLYANDPGAFLHYLKSITFEGDCRTRDLGTHNLWNIDRLSKEYDCDLSVVMAPSTLVNRALLDDRFFLPQWISADVDLDEKSIYKGHSPSRRRDIRKLDTGNLSYEITTKPADLDYFYSKMYSPTMDSAHGPAAIKMPANLMTERVSSGEAELVYIRNNDEPVGGSFIVYDSGLPRLLSMGILHGDRTHLRTGVGDAIYLFTFRHLLERGNFSVDIGRTRPFLNDGTLYYKRRLGMRLTTGSRNGFFIRFIKKNSAVADFLCANPFVYRHQSTLKGLAFYRDDTEQDAAVGQQLPGLADFTIIDIRKGIPESPKSL